MADDSKQETVASKVLAARGGVPAGVLGAIPKDFKRAEIKKAMPQAQKARIVAEGVLDHLYDDITCTAGSLETALAGQVSGRIGVTLGAGIGGQGGLRLHQIGGAVMPVKENAYAALNAMGDVAIGKWLATRGLTAEELLAWVKGLQSVVEAVS